MLDLQERTETVTAPAKRWKNQWRAESDHFGVCPKCLRRSYHTSGEVFLNCCRVFPSSDVAQTCAARANRRNSEYVGPVSLDD